MKVLISRSIRTPPMPPPYFVVQNYRFIYFGGGGLVDKLIVCAKIDHMYIPIIQSIHFSQLQAITKLVHFNTRNMYCIIINSCQ